MSTLPASLTCQAEAASGRAMPARLRPRLLRAFATGALLSVAALPLLVQAQASSGRIYRCGNEYTNNPYDAQQRGCKPLEGANVTIIESGRSNGSAAPAPVPAPGASPRSTPSASPPNAPRVDTAEQRARDAQARVILEAELRRAEQQLADLRRDYNNGEPEKQGPEFRNHQKYLDRVAEMKAAITRTESDIAGIRRELGRLPLR